MPFLWCSDKDYAKWFPLYLCLIYGHHSPFFNLGLLVDCLYESLPFTILMSSRLARTFSFLLWFSCKVLGPGLWSLGVVMPVTLFRWYYVFWCSLMEKLYLEFKRYFLNGNNPPLKENPKRKYQYPVVLSGYNFRTDIDNWWRNKYLRMKNSSESLIVFMIPDI